MTLIPTSGVEKSAIFNEMRTLFTELVRINAEESIDAALSEDTASTPEHMTVDYPAAPLVLLKTAFANVLGYRLLPIVSCAP